jgi:hypothetical protein
VLTMSSWTRRGFMVPFWLVRLAKRRISLLGSGQSRAAGPGRVPPKSGQFDRNPVDLLRTWPRRTCRREADEVLRSTIGRHLQWNSPRACSNRISDGLHALTRSQTACTQDGQPRQSSGARPVAATQPIKPACREPVVGAATVAKSTFNPSRAYSAKPGRCSSMNRLI